MIKRPMKGAAIDDLSVVRYPTMAFPKIDGFRCVLKEQPLTSRLSPFPNRHFHKELSGLLPFGPLLDGEVVVGKKRGPGVLGRTSSGLTSEDGEPDFHLWVFDAPNLMDVFQTRFEHAKALVKKLNHPRVRLLTPRWIPNSTMLKEYLDECLELGYEGIIIRDPDGFYKEGKSTINQQGMLKIKPFDTAEGRITGWYEEMENTNEPKREITGKLKRSSAKAGKFGKGRLGGLILDDCKTGIEVRVGGFTAAYRDGLWRLIQKSPEKVLGLLTRYKKQRVGEKDKPRHPNFKEFVDFRPEWDFLEDEAE